MGSIPALESWWSKDTVAVVTGANKGIGYYIVRQLAEHGLTVVLTVRDEGRGQAAVDGLKAQGLKSVVFHKLDVRSSESVKNLATWLKKEFGGIDILVNNAGMSGTTVNYENAKDILDTNFYGVKKVTEALLPLLRASSAAARIVNVSSRMGLYERLKSEMLKRELRDEEKYSEVLIESLAKKYLEDAKAGRTEEEGWIPKLGGKAPMYSESKIFLNAYAVVLAKSLSKLQPKDHQILVASFCPGPTQTDILDLSIEGGFNVPDGHPIKTIADGADTGVWLALLPKQEFVEKNGKFFAERAEFAFGWDAPF